MTLRTLFQFLVIVSLAACVPATSSPTAPVPQPTTPPELPDLAVAQAISFDPGDCRFAYMIRAVIENRGLAPALDVFAVEQSTGYQFQIGTIEALHSMEIPIPLNSNGGLYTLVVDPKNTVQESDESNNVQSYFGPTPTAPDASSPPSLAGLTYADMSLAQIWKFLPREQPAQLMEGTAAQFSANGQQALFERSGDLWLAEPMDNPGVNLTNTPERYEQSPRWWASNPAKIVFNSMDNNEVQTKDWSRGAGGYLSMMNDDGSEYVTLSHTPSYTLPAPSPDGRTIAYDALGVPMLYEIGTGAHPLNVSRYGYQTKASNTMFTNPSFSPNGRWLTWWASEGTPEQQKQFSLVIFDLTGETSAVLHSYAPLAGTSGWLDAPAWSLDGQWIAFQTRSEATPSDLWIIREDGTMKQRFGLATNPVWSPDSQRLAYVQQSPHSDPTGTANLAIINVPSWGIQQNCISTGGGIPLAWTAITP